LTFMEGNGLPKAVVSRIEALPLPKQREALERWMRELRANGLSEKTLELYSSHLKVLGCAIPKPFDKLTREDLVDHLGGIEKIGTRNSVGQVTKNFLRWLYKGAVPDCISWWKPGRVDLALDAEDILTEMEIQKLVAHASTLRDKALISVLYDSGARIGSILSLRRMDITTDQYGGVILLRGDKTGKRRIRIVNSMPVLRDHLNGLADKRPESGIWFTHDGRQLGYQGAANAIGAAGRLAKIGKPVRPHMLRHARATELARQNISQFAAEAQLGWVPGSSMWQRYVHLTGGDTDREILRANGVSVKQERTESALKPIKCPTCRVDNDPSYSFCAKCGTNLIPEAEFNAEYVVQVLADHLFPWPDEVGELTPKESDPGLLVPDDKHKQVFEDLRRDRVEEIKTLLSMIQALGKKPTKSAR